MFTYSAIRKALSGYKIKKLNMGQKIDFIGKYFRKYINEHL